MKKLLPWLLMSAVASALAQEGRHRPQGYGPRWQPAAQAPMAPAGGMSWEERQRLRDELKVARHPAWREGGRMPQADPRRPPPQYMPPEERERLRRDIREANRDLQGRR